ncbi:unnamed protein product [Mytilus coruscus]|uniref:J domain-containing protein n=1 Tax=Mytilus coruscus TaxID=42192 RepID=A0A6J8DT54_MYTCO|nr:unnamed protein product [Mytilus coruscus]
MSSRARERRRCLEVLGVQEDATDDDIKKAYRRMALIFHPDKNQSEDAKEKFQEIGYAHKYLIEGPSAVGFQEDGQFTGQAGGHDVPINILTRLFPWMMGDFGLARPSPSPFGGLFGHHFSSPFHQSPIQQFFMDPFSGMHGFDDYDDSDDGEEIVIMQNGRITVIKSGNKGHSRRRRNTRRPQQHHDPFLSRSQQHHDPFLSRSQQHHDPFLSRSAHLNNRQSQFHSDNSRTHHLTSDNVHRPSSRFDPRRSSDTSDFYHRRSTTSQNSSTNTPNKASYGSGNLNDQFTTGTQSSGTSKVHSTPTQNNDSKEGKSKTKPQTVITSRKERKKQKKANKPASQTKPATSNVTTGDDMPEMVESGSEDNDSIYDNIDDIETSQVPLKLNKKQRRKLKRERERLEKKMAQTNSGNVKLSRIPQEVEEDDETSSNSSATNAAEEKRKQEHADDNIHLFDHLAPQSYQDEEEMLRIAMEISKMEVNNIDDDSFSQDDTHSNYDNLTNEGQSSKSQDNTSWYDDIGKSPFAKTPMEDMKKTYYKDMSSTNFDPASYYKSSQPQEPRSQKNYSKYNKENFASGHSSGVDSTSRSHGATSQGHEPSSNSQNTRYYYSKDNKGPEKPVEQHHQKYFKSSTKPYNSQKEKHSFDLDEPDDVPLNLNDVKTRGAPIGSFHTQEVLNNSLNVPKGIHVTQINHVYRKK